MRERHALTAESGEITTMTILNRIPRASTSLLLLATAAAASACGQEAGIAERHIQGVATLPPMQVVEQETTAAATNDTVDTAENGGIPAYHTILVDGTVDITPVDKETTTIDKDVFQFAAGIPGNTLIELTAAEEGGQVPVQLTVYDDTGAVLSDASTNYSDLVLVPTYVITVSEEQEFFVEVTGPEEPSGDAYSYRLILTHQEPVDDEDPNAPSSLNYRTEPILVGAFLGENTSNLGNPVSGTTVDDWTYDVASFTWWGPFEMWAVQQVTAEADVILAGMDDGLDNNCDGNVDGGNIRSNTGRFDDADGDGATEVDGDCDDNDDTVRPGFADAWGDRIDNDCDGWADNGPDGTDRDGDGYSNFDGDCNDTDPAIFPGLAGEVEACDGIDDDCSGTAGDDGGGDQSCITVTGQNLRNSEDQDGDGSAPKDGDCNDSDATIHPDPESEGEEPGNTHFYDWQNFVDNDCDGDVDENYEYIGPDGELNPDYVGLDQDEDNYTMDQGDCNDTNALVGPGNYETTTEYSVNPYVDRVYIYAGSFADLNNTATGPGDVVTSQLLPVDISDLSSEWVLDEGWGDESNGGQLIPTGILNVSIDAFVPVTYCNRVEETPEADAANNPPYGEVPPEGSIELGTTCGDGSVLRADGEFTTVVQNSWDGDTDSYHLTTGAEGTLTVYMNWPDTAADYDVLVYCYFGDEFNPYNYYEMTGSAGATDNSSNPGYETTVTVVPMSAGTECWVWVAGYAGEPGPYTIKAYH